MSAGIAGNLMSNAVKFTAGAHVGLSFATLDETRWVIQVTDTGRVFPTMRLEH